MTYSKKRFLSNLGYLMKKKNVRIGEIETAANLSAGYFSRIKGEENDSQCPNIEALYAIAEKLDVSLDFLLNAELTSLNDSEEYLLKFINWLIKNTEIGKLDWKKQYMEDVTNDGKHPLNHWVAEVGYNSDPYLVYDSLFTNKQLEIANDVCYLDLEDNKRIYLVQCRFTDQEESPFMQYEMYMMLGKEKRKVANGGDDTKSVFEKTLSNLFSFALKSSNDVKLEGDVKEEIKKFMDIIDLPF